MENRKGDQWRTAKGTNGKPQRGPVEEYSLDCFGQDDKLALEQQCKGLKRKQCRWQEFKQSYRQWKVMPNDIWGGRGDGGGPLKRYASFCPGAVWF